MHKHTSRLILDMGHDNPGEGRTQSVFTNPRHLADWGYNGQILTGYVQAVTTFDTFDADIFPIGSQERQWVEERAGEMEQRIQTAKQAGISAFCHADLLVFPKSLVEKYQHELCNHEGKIDIHRPFTQYMLRVLIDGIFRRFPELDGLVVRYGETYLHDLPHHTGNNPILNGAASHIELLTVLRDMICVAHEKFLIYRTWDFNGLHENLDKYLEISDAIEPHRNLLFSMKHVAGDFWRTIPFNPCIGQGKHRQLIEVQCQREYEGKGAHPNYIAKGVIEGWEEYEQLMPPATNQCLRDVVDHPNFAGIWTWSRGGGWEGPYIQHELWCELNAYVLVQWAQQPERSEAEVFDEVCERIGIQHESQAAFRRLCLLSADGVLRGQVSYEGGVDLFSDQVKNSQAASYYSIETGIEILWTRDHYIGGVDQLQRTLATILQEGRMAKVLADRETAAQIWQEIERLSTTILCTDPDIREYIVVSATYGRIKYQIFEKSWKIMLLAKTGEQSGSMPSEKLQPLIAEYDQLWQEWQELAAQHPLCATLYHAHYCQYIPDKGMIAAPGIGETISRYRKP